MEALLPDDILQEICLSTEILLTVQEYATQERLKTIMVNRTKSNFSVLSSEQVYTCLRGRGLCAVRFNLKKFEHVQGAGAGALHREQARALYSGNPQLCGYTDRQS